MEKEIVNQVQEAQRVPYRINPRRNTPRHILIKLKTKHKEEYTFSSTHGTFSRIDHILGHKSNFSKVKKIEIVTSNFSNNSAMRPDINYKEKNVKKHMEMKQYISK